MEYQKNTNLLGNIPDKVPRFITKKRIEVHNESGVSYSANKQIRFKHQRYNRICVITAKHMLLSREILLLKERIMGIEKTGFWHLQIM